MTVTEILADNLRRLMQGKTAAEWTNQNDALTLIVDFALLPPTRSSLQDLDPIAAHAGVEPWQLLAPLMGKGRWVSGLDLMHGPAQDTYDAAVDAAMEARK